MALNFQDKYGHQALDAKQHYDHFTGNSIVNGVAPSAGSTGLEVDIASGTAIVNGSETSVSSQTVTLNAADSTNPRKDVITIDSTGSATVYTGTAESRKPEQNATKFDLQRPAPDDLNGVNEAVVAEVFVAEGATSLGSEDVRDRRNIASMSAGSLDMFGDIDMKSNSITSVNQVDGVNITSHASRHESGGADTINHDSLTGFVANEHIDHSTVNISAGNALTGGGDITASRTIDVATGGIGTNEVDESANFSFSNLGATTINGNLDMSDNRIKNAVVDTDGDLAFFDDTEIHFGNDVDFKLDFQSSTGQMVFRDTNNNFIWGFDTSGVDFRGLNLNDVASIDGGGDAISVNDAINLGNSNSIQDAGTDAIQFDGSANVTIPNGDLNITNGNDIELSNGDGRIATGAGKDTFKKMRNEPSLSDTGKAELINEEGFGGMVVVNNRSGGSAAIFMIDDGANSVTEVADPSNSFSTTEGNAGTTNVYWDSTNSRYEIENQEGAPKAYGIHLLT